MKHSRHFWRGLFFILLVTALCGGMAAPAGYVPVRAAPQMQAAAGDIVISEFRFRGSGGGNDEFIEFYNRTNSTIDLSGWKVKGSNNNTTPSISVRFTFPTGTQLNSGQYFLLGNQSFTDVPADDLYDVATGITSDGGVAITLPDDAIIDQVGIGTNSAFKENNVLPELTTDQDRSYQRKLGGASDSCQDTDDNFADFQLIDPSNPQTSSTPLSLCGVILPTPTSTSTPTDTGTPTNTGTSTSTSTATGTPTNTGTATPTATAGPSNKIYINEVAWAGTMANPDDEWIELYNPSTNAVNLNGWVLKSDDNTPNISLTGYSIPSNGFLVLARKTGTFNDLTPDIVYGDTGTVALGNSGEILNLIDSSGKTVDTANSDGGSWPAGIGSPTYATMERIGTTNQWITFAGSDPIAHDRADNLIQGTPGEPNWISTITRTTITSDTPDPSRVGDNVTVNITVIGGKTIPTGTVTVTGTNATTCTFTLTAASAGKGSCTIKFSQTGVKTIRATFTSNSGDPSSNDTEQHQVSTTSGFRTPTPTRPPTAIPPPPLIGINEFVPRPGHDWNNDGVINTNDEYIELINHGVIDVNLNGYSLDDEVNIGSEPFRLPSVTLRPGERRVFYGSETGLLLSDGGDGVRLLKPNGQLGDAYNYFVVRFPDQSYCRLPDNGGLDDWNQNCFPTPGLQNSLSASSVNPPTSHNAENLCPVADTLPADFVLAECLPFGNNIFNPAYWDRFGWFDEKYLPESTGKWPVFVD